MSSLISRLGLERERNVQKLFPEPVSLCLLYKASHHGFTMYALREKSENQGRFVLTVYLETGAVRGGYISKHLARQACADPKAFVFSVDEKSATSFPVQDHSKAFLFEGQKVAFGDCLQLLSENKKMYVVSKPDDIYGDFWAEETADCLEVEVHRVQDVGDVLLNPWMEVAWTENHKEELRQNLVSFKPSEVLSKARVLLLGPVGSGKSSFINSIRSVMYRHVFLMPYVGTMQDGFTKKLKSYEIRAQKGGPPTPLTLCDVLALGESEETGLTLHDTLEVIKGHVPEGHKFQSNAPINPATAGYQLAPALKDRIHCVAFVLDATEVHLYSKSLQDKLKELRWEISDMDIPHVILLTKVDQVCKAVEADVQYVYRSRIVKERMHKAAELMGLPVSFVLPVKNYSSGRSVDCNTDILLLSALNCMLCSIDDWLEDYTPSPQEIEQQRQTF
ncbi:interferon-induced protein 44-like isoform X1 [Anguilla rostrata]